MTSAVSQDSPLIVHIIYRLGVGGLENGLINIINNLPVDRFRHAIICLTDSNDFSQRIKRDDVAIYQMHKQPGHDWGLFVRIYQLLKRLKPAIVHSRNLAALEYQLCALVAKVPYRVHSDHGWDVYDPDGNVVKYQRLRLFLSPIVHQFIALSIQLEDYLVRKVGINAHKVTRICNGVDTSVFYPVQRDKPIFDDCPLAMGNKIVFGTVGRMHGVKDQLTLVNAFIDACAVSADFADQALLVLVGDGPLREPAIELLAANNLLDKAWLPGSRSDVADILRCFDVFVLPSQAEGISNTILEAMATGLPVIATRVGGNPELVIDKQTGYLVEKQQIAEMSVAMQSLVSDKYLRLSFANAASLRVQSEFSITCMIARYQQMYDKANP